MHLKSIYDMRDGESLDGLIMSCPPYAWLSGISFFFPLSPLLLRSLCLSGCVNETESQCAFVAITLCCPNRMFLTMNVYESIDQLLESEVESRSQHMG